MNGASYVSESGNAKIMGTKKVDATYASIKSSCPKTCPLMGEGCYAELGHTGIHVKRLDEQADGLSPLQVARAEANAIDESYKGGPVPSGRDLRIHVSGDCRTIAGARLVNKAVGRWKKRGGGNAWSYTHAFRNVHRDNWSNVSILASIDTVDQVDEARQQGYAPAIVVPEFTSDKVFTMPGSDTKWIPCPNQTKPGGKEIGCSDCKLCMKADWLFETNRGIAFSVHGIKKNNIKRRLTVVQ
jgi:hypothetical protein